MHKQALAALGQIVKHMQKHKWTVKDLIKNFDADGDDGVLNSEDILQAFMAIDGVDITLQQV